MSPPQSHGGARLGLALALAALAIAAVWFLWSHGAATPDAATPGVEGPQDADPERAARALRGAATRTPEALPEDPGRGSAGSIATAPAAGAAATDAGAASAPAGASGIPLRLTGRVLDPQGAPVAEAWLEAGFGTLAPVASNAMPSPAGAPRSGSDGSFTLTVVEPTAETARLTLRAARSCYRTATTAVEWQRGRPVAPVLLTLVPVCVVTGVVVDDASQPVGDAQVLVLARARARTVDAQPTRSAADGRFAFAVEEPGPCQVQVRAQGFALCIAPGPDAVPGRELDAGTFTLQRGYAIRGMVLGVDGAPLAGRQVVAQPATTGSGALPARTQTGADGGFELQGLLRESYALSAPGPVLASFRAGVAPAHVVAAPADGVLLRVDEHLLAVSLVDATTGAAIHNGEVRVLRRVGATVESDAVGQKASEFVIAVESGVEYGLVGRARDYEASAEVQVTLGAQEARRAVPLRLKRQSATNELQLQVTADSGEAITHVRIELFQLDDRGRTFLAHEDRQASDGNYRLGPWSPGRYQLRVHALRGAAEKLPFFRAQLTVELGQDGHERRELVLRRGGLFALHVKDAQGRYLGNVAVLLRRDGIEVPMDYCVFTEDTTSCDRNRVPQPGPAVPDDALAPGEYTLELSCAGLARATVPVLLRAGEVTPVEVLLR